MKKIKPLMSVKRKIHSMLFYLRNQILTFIVLTFLVYIGIISFFIVKGYNNVIINKTQELTKAYMETINTSLNILQGHTEEIASLLKNSSDVQTALSDDNYNANSIFRYNYNLRKLVINIMYSNNWIDAVYMGNDNYSYQYNIDPVTARYWPDYEKLCGFLKGYDTNELYSGIWLTGEELGIKDESSLFFVQKIRNLDTIQNIGITVIEIKASFLDQAINSAIYGNDTTIAFIKNNKVLYANNTAIPEENLISTAGRYEIMNDENVGNVIKMDGKKYFLSIKKNGVLELSMISLITYKSLMKESAVLHITIILLLFAFFIFLIIFTYFFSNRLVKQVSLIKEIFEHASGMGIPESNLPFRNDEIGHIGKECEDLMCRYHISLKQAYELNIKQKESALLRLQSQINPHFLYNTLDSIYWMCETKGNHDAARMALYLSRYFRANIGKEEMMVTLCEELDGIRNYIAIQNIRYDDKFIFTARIPEEFYQKEILRMLIQPLIENAIYHGLEPQTGKGTIELSVEKTNSNMIIKVEDNGVGFQSGSLKKGLALNNIDERIRLFYGDSYGMQIESQPDVGTIVTLTLPWEGKRNV